MIPIPGRSFPVAAALVAALALAPARAHEFWIEPIGPAPAVGGTLEAHLHTGQYLSAAASSWDPKRFETLVAIDAEGERELSGTRGERPAVRVAARSPGPLILAGETRPQSVRYPRLEKFQRFVEFEGAPEIAERHVEAGLPTRNIVELYTRYAKALVRVGGASAPDRAVGLELELVALDDPFAAAADGPPLGFELRLDGEPLADVQVALFHREGPNPGEGAGADGPPEGVTRTLARTDAEGRVAFAPPGAGTSLVSAVLIRRPDARTMLSSGATWESLWASLAFALD